MTISATKPIEIGLASMSSILFGLTVLIYGVALALDQRFLQWFGILAIVSGAATTIAGIVIAYTGFSDVSMFINMPASLLLIVWIVALGVDAWRKPTPT